MLPALEERMIDVMTTSTGSSEAFQIPLEAAEYYEAAFVPAFFAQWAPVLCDDAGVSPGQTVLDVACGTGIVARTAAELVVPDGKVTGVDLNDAMLTVARRVGSSLDWRQGDAADLPFPDESFDVALCQMALMFFPEPAAAVREMARVVTRAGTVGVLVPGSLEHQPAFAPLVEMIVGHAGEEARSLLSTYFLCGDVDELGRVFESAGLEVTTSRTQAGIYGAPSVDAAVTTEVESTPLAERISDDVYRRIRDDAQDVLAPFTTADGGLAAPFECNIVTAHRR